MKNIAVAGLAATVGMTALASSHREAPSITKTPKVDGTDFYMFNSYESGRSDYVTLIANYIPLQNADDGSNYYAMNPNALYGIHVDSNGDAKEDVTFQFRFQQALKDLKVPVGVTINNGLTRQQQRWLALMLADMALRLNDGKLATLAFEQLNQYSSMPILAAKADWLLAHGQWQSVKNLLKDHTDNDALLLRLLIAEQHLKDADFVAHFKLMGERVQVWDERGEVAHQREAAQYALLFQNPKPALKLAQLNWQRQRETADIVVYANAAINNQSTADIQIIQEWIQKTGFEYPLLTQALAQKLLQKQSSLKKIQGTAK